MHSRNNTGLVRKDRKVTVQRWVEAMVGDREYHKPLHTPTWLGGKITDKFINKKIIVEKKGKVYF